jgi:hypothetical protein
MSIDVAPGELQAPADRFRRVGDDFRTLGEVLGGVLGAAAAAAGNGDVAAGCEVFRGGMQAVLPALAAAAGLLGENVRHAAVAYANADDEAVAVTALTAPEPRLA